jgi:predicted PurR-regulated permease PerM
MSLPPDTAQKRASLIAFLLVMALLIVAVAKMVAPYLLAIAMGGILALLSQPAFRWLLRKKLKRSLAALAVTFGVIFLVVTPFLAFASMATKQAITIARKVSESDVSVDELLTKVTAWGPVHLFVDDPAELETMVKTGLQSTGKNLSATVLALAGGVPAVALQLVLACIACYFFLVDGRSAVNWFATKIPIDSEIQTRLKGSFKDTAISVVWASMAAAAAQALVMSIGYVALGVPAAYLAGGATFILAWIPLVGTAPVWLVGAGYLYMKGSVTKVVIMWAIGFLTSIVDNFVRPWVLKGRGEMHPLVSLVAIFGGISLFGIVGVFFGPILAALVITVLQVWPTVGRRWGLQFAGAVEAPNAPIETGSVILK